MSGDIPKWALEGSRRPILANYLSKDCSSCHSLPTQTRCEPQTIDSCPQVVSLLKFSLLQHKMLEVVVIGGGIAGFSAAIALRLSGHTVTLLEKEEEFKEASTSILLDSHNIVRQA